MRQLTSVLAYQFDWHQLARWDEDVAPNQLINRRQKLAVKMREEAKSWGSLSTEEIFAKFDTDGNGTIDHAAVERLSMGLGLHLSTKAQEEMFAEMDDDNSGAVDFQVRRGCHHICTHTFPCQRRHHMYTASAI